ncbi:filamentation induced by cAMP protein fic [Candidatus Magnetoovum chiemensis]|nr:filamentation induced by cAMP protein fic [Candidatus Magnetoovum chiemensis]
MLSHIAYNNAMDKKFQHYDLKLINPPFASDATDLIVELERLRSKFIASSTPKHIFFEVKRIFHLLESIASARIEGNRTTIAQYIETKLSPSKQPNEAIREIENMEKALDFIEENVEHSPIDRAFLSEIHKITTANLTKEGSSTPGEYRRSGVSIVGSRHIPPDPIKVHDYMEELFKFINDNDAHKYDLIKTALSHHRFVWIHPFDNGNGRTVRLLTYAMLIKQGFSLHNGRIINPTAVFCSDREQYYNLLSAADDGSDKGLLNWCSYMLNGLKNEIVKIDRLCDYQYLKKTILLPTLDFALQRKLITDIERKILHLSIENDELTNSDVRKTVPQFSKVHISRLITSLKEKKMLCAVKEKARKYLKSFYNNYLLRGVISLLGENGFLPKED